MTPFRARFAAHILRTGGLVAYPTEAVYGLGCDPLDEAAVRRVLRIKRRPFGKGLILIAHRLSCLRPFIREVAVSAEFRATRTWPGPVTWVWPASARCPEWITGGRDTVAVRVTAHPIAAALCRCFGGAIVSTSANPSSRPPARTSLEVRRRLAVPPDFILGGPVGPSSQPTKILDLATGKVIRPT